VSDAAARLTPLETLWSVPVGFDASAAPLAVDHRGTVPAPREALEEAVLPALRRPPCLVSFSGGVDSSVVLALAAHVARREGLEPPIPATHRFPGVPEADETDWQERVVAHLGLADWLRLEWTDELDLIGPVAARLLRRHGPLVPFNGHFQLPFVERAAGGALLTGVGGDELFAPVHRATAAHVLHRHRAPRLRDLPALAFGVTPRRARAALVARRRGFERCGWIRPQARRQLARAYGAWEAAEPLRWDRALCDWWWRSRALQCNLAGKRALGAAADVLVESPFAAPAVLVAWALAGGAVGIGGRASALEPIAGELLPSGLLARGSKASFDGAFWASHARAFAAAWNGDGVDPACVDVAALRAEWARSRPDPHSFALLQQAWLAAAD
jgi:asparagine synthase (glutamine-hydrolysing)